MGTKIKEIIFPPELTVSEFESLLATNGLFPPHDKDQYYDMRMTQDIDKYKSKTVRLAYLPRDNVVCSYSVIEVTPDHDDNE
jgi:hypothetical protein|tara:strand:+ start:413 stop:658 length:246 start_codon:yes stop_codon:yes gene_type:complete